MENITADILNDEVEHINTDENAMQKDMVNEYIRLVYKICITSLGKCCPSAADDACQQVFLNFIRSNPKFTQKFQEKAWFIRTALNVCKNIIKQNKNKNNNVDIEEADSYGYTVISNNTDSVNSAIEISEILSILPYKLSDAFFLVCLEDYTAEEAAKVLKIKTGAILMRVNRAREILKKNYTKEDFFHE